MPAADSKGAADHGAAANGQSVSLRVYLAPKGGEAALEAAVAAVSDPSSASYRHYLTPAQFRARYQPTARTVGSVSAWLRSSGLKVTGLEASSRYIRATGTVAAAETAFATQLHDFAKDGKTFRAPTGRGPSPARSARASSPSPGCRRRGTR